MPVDDNAEQIGGKTQLPKGCIGAILIWPNGHKITLPDMASSYSIDEKPTVEYLQYAAGVLARWLDLPYEDRAKECQRIAARDQFEAMIKDIARNVLHGCDQ